MTTYVPSPGEFIDTARRAFAFLIEDFGFVEEPVSKRLYHNPVSVRYESPTTLVVVQGMDWGYSTSVDLGRMPQLRELDLTIPLWPIVKLRRPDIDLSVSGQIDQIAVCAHSLRECASDVLRGDFEVFPEAERLVDLRLASIREREAEKEFHRIVALAGEAFWRKQYSRVIQLLEPLQDHLNATDKRKLSFARNHAANRVGGGIAAPTPHTT